MAEEITAMNVLKAYARLRVRGGCHVVTYGDLAEELGHDPAKTGLPVSQTLDHVAQLCEAFGLPDIETVIVSKSTLDKGSLLPPQKVIDKFGGQHAVLEEAARLREFDWLAWANS